MTKVSWFAYETQRCADTLTEFAGTLLGFDDYVSKLLSILLSHFKEPDTNLM